MLIILSLIFFIIWLTYKQIKKYIININENKKKLNILLISDIHSETKKIEELKECIKNGGKKINLIIISGDILLLNGSQLNTKTKEHLEILEKLKEITTNILFIPGNHDSKYLYDSIPEDEENTDEWIPLPVRIKNFNETSENIHNKIIKLNENIYIAGYGGSVDSYQYTDKTNIIWKGYPYAEEQYFFGINNLLETWNKVKKTEKDSLILVTHQGPAWCDTSIKNVTPYLSETKIQGGSESSYEIMIKKEYQESNNGPFIWIHGHTHKSQGKMNLGNIQVVNPGALLYGNYSTLSLKKVNDKWIYDSIDFHTF